MTARRLQIGGLRTALSLVGCLALLSGCGGANGASVRDALEDRGIDVASLFAPPVANELAAVRARWESTRLPPTDVREEATFDLESGDTMRVLSHRVGTQRHYGIVILPAGDHAPGTLPVLVSLVGFGIDMALEVPSDARAYDGTYLSIFPSFRGHELRFETNVWTSDGDPFDQCNGGTDDALAFLEAALSVTPEADADTVVALGGSRGGNVAMLAGIRRADVDAIASIAGPTDYLQEPLLDHPNLAPLYANYFLADLLAGVPDTDEARLRMLACSPIHFAEQLPPVQIHHGTADRNVPLEQAELLAGAMAELGRTSPEFEFFVYEGADHQFELEQQVIGTRVDAFFTEIVGP